MWVKNLRACRDEQFRVLTKWTGANALFIFARIYDQIIVLLPLIR